MEELHSFEDLLDLQALDSAIDRLLEERSSLPELERYRAAHDEVVALRKRLEKAEADLREVDLEEDRIEGELEIVEQKAEIEERRLYAGGLSARETEALRMEVEQLTRRRSEMEDRALALLDEKEKLAAVVAEIREALAAAEAVEKELEATIADAWRRIDGEIAAKEARKAEIVPLIDPELLELYERIRPHKEGVAIARLEHGICQGCHLQLSAAELAEAKRESPPRCVHCRRILVP